MIDTATLQRLASSPAAFRSALMLAGARGTVRLVGALAPFQQGRFASLDPALLAASKGEQPPCGRYWWEGTKGSSKDTDLAICLLWLLAFSPRSLTCQIRAADEAQADELRKAAKGILKANPWLSDAIEIQSSKIVSSRTESVAEIIPADVAGSHGARPDLLILNELTHVSKEEFAQNLLDNAAKVPRGVVVIATNAGQSESWQWNWRELARTSPRWTFHKWDKPAPWLSADEIEEAKRRNPLSRYLRLFEGVWSTGDGEGLADEDVTASVKYPDPMRGFEFGCSFIAGLDLAVRRDNCGFAVLAAEHQMQRVRVAYVADWAPGPNREVDLRQVKDDVRMALNRFNAPPCIYDPSQAELMAQELRAEGFTMMACPQTGKNLSVQASVLMEAFRSRRIDLYDDPRLIRDIKRLKILETSYGLKLDAARSEHGHCDIGKAVTFALPLAVTLCNQTLSAPVPEVEFISDMGSGPEDFSMDPFAAERAAGWNFSGPPMRPRGY